MNQKNFKIILITLLILTLYGCGRSDYQPLYNPHTGSQGLEIRFIENAPPNQVYELDTFPVGIILKNKGASNIERGIININYQKDYFTEQISADKTILLRGRTTFDPNGEEKTRLFYFETKKMDSMSQIRDSLIAVNACYEYSTQLKTEACIDPDIYDIMRDRTKPCRVEPKSFSGQGAPVGIVHINPTISFDPLNEDLIIPQFELTIQNLDRGNVIERNSLNRFCSDQGITRDEFNKVEVYARMGTDLLECNPAIVELDNRGQGKTRCRLNQGIYGATTAYNSLLEIHLLYGYTATISKEFKIHRR